MNYHPAHNARLSASAKDAHGRVDRCSTVPAHGFYILPPVKRRAVEMKSSDTRRQFFRAIVAGAATVPFIAFSKKSTASQPISSGPPRAMHCLLKGTTIATPCGDRLVQDLQIGEGICTASGPKEIKWIGYNKFTNEPDKAWQASVMPIRVARSALDDHSPRSHLYISPWHCIFVDNVLIPAKYLINGSSVKPGMPSDLSSAVEYYHIDLGTHEVIYAEGAPVESFFDGYTDREDFSNFVQYERLYGPERQSKMTPFAAILTYHNRHERVRGRMRSWVSNVIDVRDRIQIAHDLIARRATYCAAI